MAEESLMCLYHSLEKDTWFLMLVNQALNCLEKKERPTFSLETKLLVSVHGMKKYFSQSPLLLKLKSGKSFSMIDQHKHL
jgi:hypothetical protein